MKKESDFISRYPLESDTTLMLNRNKNSSTWIGGAGSTWVGRSGGPSRDGRQRRQPGGSVGRTVPTRNLLRRAARGGSVGREYRVGNATYGYS